MTSHEVLWEPDPADRADTNIGHFLAWLQSEGILAGTEYEDLWRWSTDDLDGFWLAVWRYFDVLGSISGDAEQPTVALAERAMPGARWFPEVSINYAENMLRLPGRADDDIVVHGVSQTRERRDLTARELRQLVARARSGLIRLGVTAGDRVAAYAPNIPETLVLLLATSSLGAIFSSCAPEFGTRSVIDRWRQIEPKVLVTIDGYRYGAKTVSRIEEAEVIRAALPTVEHGVRISYLEVSEPDSGTRWLPWSGLLAEDGDLTFDRVPFDHPLWVLFSSGTTGLPKPIVHSHGGMTVEQLKATAIEMDLRPQDTFFWFSTTGWTMWNILVSGLFAGSTIVMFDGDPGHPDLMTLWRMAEELRITYFGTSAVALTALRTVGSTGSPLPAEWYRWVYEAVGKDLVLASLSGGTDVCTGFVGANRLLPVYSGEFACRCLGAAVASYDAQARPVLDEVGELVVTQPMPTMPVFFWNDPDGRRYRAAYFEQFPGVWRHGDWIELHADGTGVITGRSDATLNRGGVRLGTAEFYAVVEAMPEIDESLVVHLEDADGGPGRLLLFVSLSNGHGLDESLRARIRAEVRDGLSPRHLPDRIVMVPSVPRTLSGKKLELPVKRILLGERLEDVASVDALVDPKSLDAFVRMQVEP
jgi:acetoacetyl-CoA synthetase